MKPFKYLQIDAKWKNKDYSAPGESTTIGKAGCGPTCMAMIIASLKDTKITPVETCAWSLKHGYKAPNQGTYYSYFVAQGNAYDIDVLRVNPSDLRKSKASAATHHATALKAIKDGDLVIACMGPGNWTKSGHYILWYGMDGNQVLINDPASLDAKREKADLALLQNEVKYYWVIKTPIKQEDPMGKSFPDVADNRWSARHIDAAKRLGLIKGDDAGNFNPTTPITREESAVIMIRLYESITGKKVTI